MQMSSSCPWIKKHKGDLMLGKDTVRGDDYIKAFDLNDEKVTIEENHLRAFTIQHAELLSILK
jgi:hypothetical protein